MDEKTNAFKYKKCGALISKNGTGYTNTVRYAKKQADWKEIIKLYVYGTQSKAITNYFKCKISSKAQYLAE